MKHKIRKITTTMLATICAFSSVAAISASAASSTRYAEMSNGYTVSSTASYSGGPCSIKVWVYGYYKSGSYVKLSCNSYDSVDNNKSLTVTTNGYYTLVGSKCISQFDSATTVSATVGKTA